MPPLEAFLKISDLKVLEWACPSHLTPGLLNLTVAYDWVNALWYTYTPKTSGPVTVLACGPVELFVFEKFWNCPHDSVHDGVYDEDDIGNCDGTSISWEALEGVTYTMFINLTDDTSALQQQNESLVTDTMFISLRESASQLQQQKESLVTVQVVDNDLCEHAFGPVPATSMGTVVSYTTVNATVDTDVATKRCGGSSAPSAPGVWYKVLGTGRAITATAPSKPHLIHR